MTGWLGLGARMLAEIAQAAAPGCLSVLIFHRVARAPDPLFPDEMHAARFESLMRLVAGSFNVLTVGEAARALAEQRLPPRALSITFDDGYADNAEVALPILQRAGLRASFFVATGFLDGGRMFNDTVIDAIRATRLDRADLDEFGLGSVALGSIGERRAAIEALLGRVKYLGLAERDGFLDRLLTALGRPLLPDEPMMSSEQVVALHRAGMEIGGHTVRHPILRVLPDAQAEREIADGRHDLQSLLDAPVDVFAYPNGRPMQDYDARHVAMVRRAGFIAAVSTSPGVARTSSDPHQIPRFSPWDRSAARWVMRLAHHRVRPPVAAVAA